MSHRAGLGKPIGSWKLALLLSAVVVTLLLVGTTIYGNSTSASSAASVAPGASYVLDFGPKDEKEVKIPILHWVLLDPSKNIIIRRPDGELFLETPGRKLYQLNKKTREYDMEVASFGSNVSKVYLRATAADVVRVEVSFVRM